MSGPVFKTGAQVTEQMVHGIIEQMMEEAFTQMQTGVQVYVPTFININGKPYRIAEYLGVTL